VKSKVEKESKSAYRNLVMIVLEFQKIELLMVGEDGVCALSKRAVKIPNIQNVVKNFFKAKIEELKINHYLIQ
jgi:hypothetical protein